jgi:hypothetical protein
MGAGMRAGAERQVWERRTLASMAGQRDISRGLNFVRGAQSVLSDLFERQ